MSCRRTMRSSSSFMRGLREQMPSLRCLRQARRTAQALSEDPLLESADVERIGVDTGSVATCSRFHARSTMM